MSDSPEPPPSHQSGGFNFAGITHPPDINAGDTLLTWGAPDSGKTTRWAVKHPLLTDWLVAKLQTLYLVPPKMAQAWVGQDDLLPWLDGLDEVTPVQVISLPVSRKGVA